MGKNKREAMVDVIFDEIERIADLESWWDSDVSLAFTQLADPKHAIPYVRKSLAEVGLYWSEDVEAEPEIEVNIRAEDLDPNAQRLVLEPENPEEVAEQIRAELLPEKSEPQKTTISKLQQAITEKLIGGLKDG